MNVLTVPLNTTSFKFDRNIINPLFFESSYSSVNTMFDEIEAQLKNFQSLKDIHSLRKKIKIILIILFLSLMVTWICVLATSISATEQPNMGLLMGISFGSFFFFVIFLAVSECFLNKRIDEIQIYYSDTINSVLKGYNSDIFNRIGIHGILEIMLIVVYQRRSTAHQTNQTNQTNLTIQTNQNMLLNINFSKNFGGGNINFLPGAIPQYNFGVQQGLGFNQGLPNQEFCNNNQNNYGMQNEYQGRL